MIGYRGMSTYLFGGLADRYVSKFSFVKTSLPKADIKIPYHVYMSMVFFSSFLAFFFSIPITFLVTSYFGIPFLQKILFLILIPLLVFFVWFVYMCFHPLHKAGGRRRNIETNLPFVLTHMGSIAESGIPPHYIFKLVSRFKEYGEIAKEMEKIDRNIESFGLDPVSAAKEVANRTPSEALKEILFGFTSTIEAGGSVTTYLREAGKEALFKWRMRRERFLGQLSTYAEIYVGVLIAAPLFMVSIFATMAMVQPVVAGIHVLELMKISIYGLIPALNLGFLLFLRGVEVEI
ncbi:MAG: type II secretion system F family protein [Candidatus Aenigmarchaeota archaeon]|nr:type II secretion system F family protein [Candidatus Aenigmarchaeota archaeon]